MKHQTSFIPKNPARFAGLLLLVAASNLALAQTDYVVDAFDTDTEANLWTRWWGSAVQSYEFDATVDEANQTASGSLKATIQFDVATYAGDNQFAANRYFTAGDGSREHLDGTLYTKMQFDLRFDTNSPTRPTSKDFGYFEYGLIPSDYSQITLGNVTVAGTNGGWNRISAPIDPAAAKLTNIIGVWVKVWAGGGTGDNNQLTGTTVFWLDNVKLIANTNTTVTPPTMALAPATAGLQLTASASGAQYQRQNICTVSNTYSWIGKAQPVTYSLTIKSFPGTNYNGFQAHVFLVPTGAQGTGTLPTWENSPDWNEANVIFLQIARGNGGNPYATFRYKTNLPNGNTMLWNANSTNGPVGALASIAPAEIEGTWSLTFKNDTNVTLTGPGGVSTNFAFPAESAALFADPLQALVGVQPNQTAYIGQSAILSQIQISGVEAPINDSFTGPSLDTNAWVIVAQDANGIVQVPAGTAFTLSWTLPANGFQLQTSSTLKTGSWIDPGLTNIYTAAGRDFVLLPVPPTGRTNVFYRLYKPAQ